MRIPWECIQRGQADYSHQGPSWAQPILRRPGHRFLPLLRDASWGFLYEHSTQPAGSWERGHSHTKSNTVVHTYIIWLNLYCHLRIQTGAPTLKEVE